MKKYLFTLLALVLIGGLLLSSCTGPATTPPASSAAPASSAVPKTSAGPAATTPTTSAVAPTASTSVPSSTQPAKVYKLTYALFMPPTAALSAANTAFAKEIETRSNGRVQITVQAGGSLLDGTTMYQGVRDGIADMGNCNIVYNPGAFPFTSIVQIPSASQSAWVASNADRDFMDKYQPKEWNAHVLNVCASGPADCALLTNKIQVTKLEDLKGMSIRDNFPDVTTALGGTVKDLPMAGAYDAISKGVLDGMLTSPEPLLSWKLGDICKYSTLYFGPQPSTIWYNIINNDKWNSLPPDIQKIFSDVSGEYVGKLGLIWDDQNIAGAKYGKTAGVKFYVLPQSESDRWKAAILPVVDAELKTIATKGFTQQTVTEAAQYYQSRVDYWNSQQAQNNILTLETRLKAAVQ